VKQLRGIFCGATSFNQTNFGLRLNSWHTDAVPTLQVSEPSYVSGVDSEVDIDYDSYDSDDEHVSINNDYFLQITQRRLGGGGGGGFFADEDEAATGGGATQAQDDQDHDMARAMQDRINVQDVCKKFRLGYD